MISIRDVLASNLKENRKRLGLSQAKLAEKAETSTQYIAMIEVSRKFPTPEMLERIAGALGIEAYELFAVKPTAEDAMQQLRNDIINNIRQIVNEAVGQAMKTQKPDM